MSLAFSQDSLALNDVCTIILYFIIEKIVNLLIIIVNKNIIKLLMSESDF